MKYAKFISQTEIEFPPKNKDGICNYDLDIDLLVQDGYKQFIEVERPETNRFYHIEYENNIDNITETIIYDETQQEADERETREERERLDQLSLTKREVFLALYKDKGIIPEQIKAQITNPEALIEFEYANDYFRGNPLINTIGQTLGYTTAQLDYLFENKELP